MQKEIGIPESKIAFNYIVHDFYAFWENERSFLTTTKVEDIAQKRLFSISSFDKPALDFNQRRNRIACFASVEDKQSTYYVAIENYSYPDHPANKYKQSLFDLLFISFTDKETGANSTASYDQNGKLSGVKTDFIAQTNLVGNLSWKQEFPAKFYLDLVDQPQFIITQWKENSTDTTNEYINEVWESRSAHDFIPEKLTKKTYITSLPFNSSDGSKVPIFMETVNNDLIITLSRPDEVSKEVRLPIQISNFNSQALQRSQVEAFISLPFESFKNNVLDNIEPISRA